MDDDDGQRQWTKVMEGMGESTNGSDRTNGSNRRDLIDSNRYYTNCICHHNKQQTQTVSIHH